MAGHAVAPKFGSWDAENIGYTVFFEKVRDNKGPPAPARAAAPKAPGGGYDFDPYEHYENLSRNVPSRPPSSHGHGHAPAPAPRAARTYDFDPYEHYEDLSRNVPSRPPSSNGHAPAPQHHRGSGNGYHRRTGSNGSSGASEASSRGSKFSPPKPYQPRYSSNNNYHHPAQQGGGHHYVAPAAPRHHPPPPPRLPKPSAVPRFGVWDEQNAAMAAQGYTVQFEKVKRHREEVKASPAPPVPPPQLSPQRDVTAPAHLYRKRKTKRSFLSKVYRCMFPVVRE
ncbi:uncharacterized protein LOC133922505 isoform X2 [Phragmites australis]|uniref:uncharacterized protein LOC133922505 isoform X2 n=1 Tax=Phragmites australis TaxID=29695 RepID=UPI002D79A111|nr:uncharacterized protein LOC133922505 isoform X2 [Phragmites australis]